MRYKHFVLCILIALCLTLSGCAQHMQPESQAIAVGMAVDLIEPGGLLVSVLLPENHASSGAEEGTSGGYYIASATGSSFAEALSILHATVPLTLNLAQLKSLVVSQELASNGIFPAIVTDMYLTHRLYSSAFFVVSLGKAQDVLRGQNKVTGLRASSAILTGMEDRIRRGGILDVRFADLYNDLHSIYPSPVAILAAAADGEHTTLTPPGRAGDALPGALPREGLAADEYAGTALFRDGRMVGTLSSLETAFLGFLRGDTRTIGYAVDGRAVDLSPVRPVSVSFDLSGSAPQIGIHALFAVTEGFSRESLARQAEADIAALVAKCQSLGVEPFCFSQRAAASFPDIAAWLEYDWPCRFPEADVSVNVEIRVLRE